MDSLVAAVGQMELYDIAEAYDRFGRERWGSFTFFASGRAWMGPRACRREEAASSSRGYERTDPRARGRE